MNERATDLNFYERWLGIECHSRPDHYRLLGVERFESDEQKILAAFDLRRDQLRHVSPGQYAAHWRKLADELIAAKRCLLTPAARLAYDEHLRYRQSQLQAKSAAGDELTFADELPAPAASIPASLLGSMSANFSGPAIELPPMDSDDDIVMGDLPDLPPMAGDAGSTLQPALFNAVGAAAVPSPAPSVAARSGSQAFRGGPQPAVSPQVVSPRPSIALAKMRRDRRQARRTMMVSIVVLGAVLSAGLILLSQLNQQRSARETGKAVAKSAPAETGKTKSAAITPTPKNRPPAISPPVAAPPDAKSPPVKSPFDRPTIELPRPSPMPISADLPPVDPQLAEAFRAALKSIRTALAERNLAEATARLAAAERLAKGDEQIQQVELHRQLVRHTGDFWNAVRDGAAKLSGGDELERNGKPLAIVVEAAADRLTIKADGRNATFNIPGDIQPTVAVAIAQRSLKDQPDENLLLGAFYATDAAGDLSKAELLWQSAGEEMGPVLDLLKSDVASRVRNN